MAHLSLFHQGCIPSEDPPQGKTLHPIPTLDMHTHWSPSSSCKHKHLQTYVNSGLCCHYLAIFKKLKNKAWPSSPSFLGIWAPEEGVCLSQCSESSSSPPHPSLCAYSQGCDHTRPVPRTSGGNETLTITSHLVAAKRDSGVRGGRDSVSGRKGRGLCHQMKSIRYAEMSVA